MGDFFRKFATKTAHAVGSAWAFLLAFMVVIIWATTGPLFNFSDTWQLVINTGTTIITFLMVFLIQNTQNRDAKAMQLKLDELILAIKDAHNELIDIEELSDEQLEALAERYKRLKEEGRADEADSAVGEEAEEAVEERRQAGKKKKVA